MCLCVSVCVCVCVCVCVHVFRSKYQLATLLAYLQYLLCFWLGINQGESSKVSMETSTLELNNFMNMHHVLLIYWLKSFSLVQSSYVGNRYLSLFMFILIFKSLYIILSCCLPQLIYIHLKLLNVTEQSLELFCVCLPHQWVSLGVTLRHLLGWGSLLGWAVAVVSHVLRP